MLVETDDTVEVETVLSRREEPLSRSYMSLFENWLMAATLEGIESSHSEFICIDNG